jgi:large subunit ribosomal protein L6
MSRVGRKPIPIPSGVTVTIKAPEVTVKGPKGTLSRSLPPTCRVEEQDGHLLVTRASDDRVQRSLHGLTRALLANMIVGVSAGFSKDLEIVGVGYKAEVKGKALVLALGYSHPVNYAIPEGISIETPEPTKIRVSGADREQVGQVAAEIRGFRPPEPYKGKGVKYAGEHIQRKAGKSAASGA